MHSHGQRKQERDRSKRSVVCGVLTPIRVSVCIHPTRCFLLLPLFFSSIPNPFLNFRVPSLFPFFSSLSSSVHSNNTLFLRGFKNSVVKDVDEVRWKKELVRCKECLLCCVAWSVIPALVGCETQNSHLKWTLYIVHPFRWCLLLASFCLNEFELLLVPYGHL
ncbi:hypothetical protein RJT34_18320 [Clitoria ternatea]|uniref:Uncharacterized protein n=1 Tax=Clitoria ternatea TaxID=43366 RepID=A0AAN9PE57_CLITE